MRLLIEDLRVSYGRELAVAGLDLQVNAGQTVALVGPNGAGKSSTLNTIMGIVRPRRGSIRFNDEQLIGKTPDTIARMGVSLVPEGRRIFTELSVRENLLLGLTVHRGESSPQEDLEEMLERFPVLRRLYRTTAGKLSGGEQQQLAIARGLLSRPELLLLDEPSLGLAPQYVDLIFDILAQLRRHGVTMLLVEQNVKRTIEFADQTYIMRAGRVELSGHRDELKQQERLTEAYLGGGS
jgi:branched-chain amino acid transport system ATP-binding protein